MFVAESGIGSATVVTSVNGGLSAEQITTLRAEMDVERKQTTAIWDFVNSLRDRMNGGSKH